MIVIGFSSVVPNCAVYTAANHTYSNRAIALCNVFGSCPDIHVITESPVRLYLFLLSNPKLCLDCPFTDNKSTFSPSNISFPYTRAIYLIRNISQ